MAASLSFFYVFQHKTYDKRNCIAGPQVHNENKK